MEHFFLNMFSHLSALLSKINYPDSSSRSHLLAEDQRWKKFKVLPSIWGSHCSWNMSWLWSLRDEMGKRGGRGVERQRNNCFVEARHMAPKIAHQGLMHMDNLNNFQLSVACGMHGSCYSLMIHWEMEQTVLIQGRPVCVQTAETQKRRWLRMSSNCLATKRGLVSLRKWVLPLNGHTSIVLFYKTLNFFMSPKWRNHSFSAKIFSRG